MSQKCSYDTQISPLCKRLPKEEKPRKFWSARDIKGDNFERVVYKKLSKSLMLSGIHRNFGADFVFLSLPNIEIECKFSHAKIFPCWIKRDWLPRFSRNVKHKIIVCNRGIQLSAKSMQLLSDNNIQLVYFDKVVDFIISLLPRILTGNHLLSNIITYCNRFTVSVSTLFSDFVSQVRKCVVCKRFLDCFKEKMVKKQLDYVPQKSS